MKHMLHRVYQGRVTLDTNRVDRKEGPLDKCDILFALNTRFCNDSCDD